MICYPTLVFLKFTPYLLKLIFYNLISYHLNYEKATFPTEKEFMEALGVIPLSSLSISLKNINLQVIMNQ